MKMMSEVKTVSKKTFRLAGKVMSYFRAPDNLTVSEWAERKRRLPPEAAAEAGAWRNTRTPYLVDIMDAFNDSRLNRLVVVAASQVGKSELEINIIGYIIDEDPGSILFIHPTLQDAKEFSRLRIDTTVRDTPVLKMKVADPNKKGSLNNLLQKAYPGGILTMCGSETAHALASKPVRYVIGDERDRWATSAGDEGDPWELARARQTTFYNRMSVEVSTPTTKGASNIERSYAAGTMERWVSQCPHCGEFQEIQWDNIRFEYDVDITNNVKTYHVHDIRYVCPVCGCISSELEMKKAAAHWEATNPGAYKNGCRSFWLTAFVSQWASWESIIQQFLEAKGETNRLKVVYNTKFGKLWEERGDIMGEDEMLLRREDYGTTDQGEPVELPEGVLALTMGVDTQDNRLEFEVLGHGHFGETWGIRYGIIMGRPDDPATWRQLDEIINHRFKFKDGVTLKISRTFVDEGGHFTQDVRQNCRARARWNVFAIKGDDGPDRPYTAPPREVKIVINNTHIGNTWQYLLGVDSGKEQIMYNLSVQEPGPKYCHFPNRDDYGPTYFNGLLSEHKTYKPKRKQPWVWEKIPGHERNEPLDCRNYAEAAFKTLPINLDAIADRLKQVRGLPAEKKQAVAKKPKAVPKTRKKKNLSMMDTW